MNEKDIQVKNFLKTVEALRGRIGRRELYAAFDGMRGIARQFGLASFDGRIGALEQNYFYLQRMLATDSPFPDAEADIDGIRDKAIGLLADMTREYMTEHGADLYYTQLRFQKMRPEETLETLLADYYDEQKRLATDPDALTDSGARQRIERIAGDIFMRLFTFAGFTAEDADTWADILTDTSIPAYDRELWLCALGIAPGVGEAVLPVYVRLCKGQEVRLKAVAFTWIVNRLLANPQDKAFGDALDEIADRNPSELLVFTEEYARVIFSRKDFRMPGFGSLIGGIGLMDPSKFGSASQADIEKLMSKLPDGAIEKAKAFQEAQLAGEDVFADILGRQRSHPFFSKMPAWFMPFHLERSELAPVVDGEGVGMATIMERMPMMNDGDKYTLMLGMAAVPENLRSSVLANSYGAIMQMMQDEEGRSMMDGAAPASDFRSAVNNFLKTLSRFMANGTMSAGLTLPDRSQAGRLEELRTWNLLLPRLSDEGISKFLVAIQERGMNGLVLRLSQMVAPETVDDRLPLALGRAYAAEGHYASATDFFESLLNGGRFIDEVLAELYVIIGKLTPENLDSLTYRILDMLRQVEKDYSSDRTFLLNLARLYNLTGDYHEALATYYNLDYILKEPDLQVKYGIGLNLLLCNEPQLVPDTFSGIDIPYEKKPAPGSIPVQAVFVLAIGHWCAGKRREGARLIADFAERTGSDLEEILKAFSALAESLRTDIDSEFTEYTVGMLPDMVRYMVRGSGFGKI